LSKLLSLSDALARYVPDGSSVVMGAGLEALVPFAAGYELVRQEKRELTLVAPISDMLFDVLIGAGCARSVVAAWVGNVSAGSGYNFRRAVEEEIPHALEVVDHSNLTLALALHAGAQGVPFLPTRSVLGTDLAARNPALKTTVCPFTGETLIAVAALRPDVAILPVQRADEEGNAQVRGNLGVIREAARASRAVIVLAEELVSAAAIRSDPNRTLVPGFLVSAVVHLPLGCHPSPCAGYYGRDHDVFHDYHRRSREREGFVAWLNEWVLSVGDHEGYLARLGPERLSGLRDG
jgi:glutaconate CoA-transferase, subunit A